MKNKLLHHFIVTLGGAQRSQGRQITVTFLVVELFLSSKKLAPHFDITMQGNTKEFVRTF